MKSHLCSSITLCLLLFASAIPSYASELGVKNVFQLSLEELLKVKVTVASRSDITINKAPGVVRIFQRDDFQRYGLRTLADVLKLTPGIQANLAQDGFTNIFIRGIYDRNVNKVLFLLDGIPQGDLYWGNISVDEMVGLFNIERIEVLNGPGSVLYGDRAFAGLINVVTQAGVNQLELGAGEQVTWENNKQKLGSDFYSGSLQLGIGNLSVALQSFDSQGFNPERDRQGELGWRDQQKRRKYGIVKYQWNEFTIMGSFNENKEPEPVVGEKDEAYIIRNPQSLSIRYSDKVGWGQINALAYQSNEDLTELEFKYEEADKQLLKNMKVGYRNGVKRGFDLDYRFNRLA